MKANNIFDVKGTNFLPVGYKGACRARPLRQKPRDSSWAM